MKIVINSCHGGFRLSQAAFRMLDELEAPKEQDEVYFFDNRHDYNLVRVVEELGAGASDECSRLEVVEWPDAVPYRINEYDGWEKVTVDVSGLLNQHREEIQEGKTCLAHTLRQYKEHLEGQMG